MKSGVVGQWASRTRDSRGARLLLVVHVTLLLAVALALPTANGEQASQPSSPFAAQLDAGGSHKTRQPTIRPVPGRLDSQVHISAIIVRSLLLPISERP